MIGELSPGLILIVGALMLPFLRGRLRAAYILALPLVAFFQLANPAQRRFGEIHVLD